METKKDIQALSAEEIVRIGYEVGIIGPVSDGNAVKFARAILAARQPAPAVSQHAGGAVPEGWQLVPKKATHEMCAALAFSYEKILAAAPHPPADAAPVDAKPVDAVAAYVPGRWFDARTIDEMQAFYLSRLPAIREAAKQHGYAIGVHGSQRRDFDLMAMQWRDNASDINTLARAIADAACGIRREGAYDWEKKPHGRLATSIPVCWTSHENSEFDNMISAGHIDLSIMELPSLVQGSASTDANPIGYIPIWAVETLSGKRQGLSGWGFEAPIHRKILPNYVPIYAAQPSPAPADAVPAQEGMQGAIQEFSDWFTERTIEATGGYRSAVEDAQDRISALIQRAASKDSERDARVVQQCTWCPDPHIESTWASHCGELWSFIDGGPKQNNVRFCHGCGRPVEIKGESN